MLSWVLRNNNNNNVYLNITEWFACPGNTKFSTPTAEMSKEERFSDVFLHACEEERY